MQESSDSPLGIPNPGTVWSIFSKHQKGVLEGDPSSPNLWLDKKAPPWFVVTSPVWMTEWGRGLLAKCQRSVKAVKVTWSFKPDACPDHCQFMGTHMLCLAWSYSLPQICICLPRSWGPYLHPDVSEPDVCSRHPTKVQNKEYAFLPCSLNPSKTRKFSPTFPLPEPFSFPPHEILLLMWTTLILLKH